MIKFIFILFCFFLKNLLNDKLKNKNKKFSYKIFIIKFIYNILLDINYIYIYI